MRAQRLGIDAYARMLGRLRTPSATRYCQMLEAGLALDEGDREQAIAHLRTAGTKNPGLRRRLGQVIGGEEGAMLVAQADAALRVMGAVDLEATTRLFVFGMIP